MPLHRLTHARPVAPALILGLATLTACAPLPVAAPPAPAASPPPAPATAKARYDVIIVGAGMAGITAARALRDAHLGVLVLEATARIGGRGITTWSTDTRQVTTSQTRFSAPIDIGGAWIHDVKTNPLTPLIVGGSWKRQPTRVTASNHFFFDRHFATDHSDPSAGHPPSPGEKRPPMEKQRFAEAYEAFEAKLEERIERNAVTDAHGKPLSARDVLDEIPAVQALSPAERRLLDLNVGPLENTVDTKDSSLEDSSEFLAGEDNLVQRGYGTFVEAYGEDIRPLVRLSKPVEKIAMVADGVVVTSGTETFAARKVIVTVSTGVLKDRKIAFDPPLPPEKIAAIEGLPMGVMDKVILEFTTDAIFPTDDHETLENTWVLYAGADPGGAGNLAIVFQPMRTNFAIGFFGGSRAAGLERQQDHGRAEMIRVTLEAIQAMCEHSVPARSQCDAKGALKAADTTTWLVNPWTRGAYAAARPGMAHLREDLAAPIESRIYFAGEATYNTTYSGSYAAAYASGLRSSRAIIDCLAREDGQPRQRCEWLPMVVAEPHHRPH